MYSKTNSHLISFKPLENAFTSKKKVAISPVLTAASFPALSETIRSENVQTIDNSYLGKVKKVNILEKDAVLPGFVQIVLDKSTRKMVYMYGPSLQNKINKEDTDFVNVNAAFNALTTLYEKRKTSYIDAWGIDTYESVFGKAIVYEEDDNDSFEEISLD